MTNLTQRIQQMSVGGLLFGGVLVFMAGPAQAVPIKNPENCQGPVTIGVATCPDKSGHWVECTKGGDYMCCVQNDQGGKDCEQIEDTVSASRLKGIRAPLGNLQVNPDTAAPTTRVPKGGIKTAPIMRRGLEGEQQGEPPPGESEQTDQPSETK